LLRHGNSFLNSLKGMFALAFYDARNGRLILSRDPAGIKPLYFARAESRLVFASEVRALLATRVVKPKLDRRGLAGFLAYGAVQHPYSLFRDMQSVPPGSTLEIALRADGEWTIAPPCRHWEYPRPDLHLTEAEAWPQVATLFEDAVRDLWMG
jgi:asparagine synthase (glutamine-hydrolysing)